MQACAAALLGILTAAFLSGCAVAVVTTGEDGGVQGKDAVSGDGFLGEDRWVVDGGRADLGSRDALGDGMGPADAPSHNDAAPQQDAPPQHDAAPQQDAPAQQDAAPQQDAPAQQDAAPQQDAPVQQDAAPQCTARQLLVNGDFDQGPNAGWARYSSIGLSADPVIYPSGLLPHPPHSGTYAAWLGGGNNMENELSQIVNVPTGTVSLQVTGYVWIETNEDQSDAYDGFWVELYRPSDASLLETLALFTNLDASSGWTGFSVQVAGTYVGQQVALVLYGYCDPYYSTNFFVDTVRLEATVCQ